MNIHGIFGAPPADLASAPPSAMQFSPLFPGSELIESLPAGSLEGITMLASPGTIERKYYIAQALRVLRPGSPFCILAPKDKGGSRISKELKEFGCEFEEDAKRHHRICQGIRSEKALDLEAALKEGEPRYVEELGLWSQPGVFSWNRVDVGSAMLAKHLLDLQGRGADLGSGIGFLSRHLLAMPRVKHLVLAEIDRRAVDCAKKNLAGKNFEIHWCDLRKEAALAKNLDFVVTNPPFHDGGIEDRALGEAFLQKSAAMLREGGECWIVANRHLPYEPILQAKFREWKILEESPVYKIIRAVK